MRHRQQNRLPSQKPDPSRRHLAARAFELLVAVFESKRNQDTMREILNFLPMEASLRTFDFDVQTKDGLKLIGRGWEPDGAPWAAVSLIHGLGEHMGRYAHVGEFLAGSGIAVLGFDLRGHGRSQGKLGHTPSYDHLYDDISRGLGVARDRYAGVPLFIYGHSLGATLALLFTIERSPDVKGIVATGPIFRPAFEPPPLKIAAGRVLDRLMPAFTMYNEINPEHVSRDPAVVKAYVEDPLVHNRISSRMGIGMLDLGLGLLKRAKELKVPVLLMCGSEDRLTSAAASREFANSAGSVCTFKVWEGLYHEIHNEPEQDQVFTHMVDWVRSRLGHT